VSTTKEIIMEQQAAQVQYDAELAAKWDGHHRILNAQPLSDRDRIAVESRARISVWASKRQAELGLTGDAQTPAAEAVVVPAVQPGTKAKVTS
jgi:hypothetical protein